jgi:hypothetical protein
LINGKKRELRKDVGHVKREVVSRWLKHEYGSLKLEENDTKSI